LCGGVLLYAAQANSQIDAEIAEKGRFRTGTGWTVCQVMNTPGTSRGYEPPQGGNSFIENLRASVSLSLVLRPHRAAKLLPFGTDSIFHTAHRIALPFGYRDP